jgi:signal transduction histidine kinase
VLANGRQQERLIDALLVMSRSQRGLERREAVDLAQVAAQALASIDTGELTVQRTLQPAGTNGDPRLVERLAANLVSNAVRHNHPGGRLSVSTRTAAGRAILTVTNTGPALSPDDLGRLFEPFQRLDGARTSRGDGLGLGLSIVKAIADAHAATITTSLPADGGLSVQVSFPSAVRVSPPPPAIAPSQRRPATPA